MADLPQRAAAPESEAELLARCELFAGMELHDIAQMLNFCLPANLRRDKGYVGQLAEHLLGADAGNLAEPDFTKLGMELKTLPVSTQGKVLESTYISVVSLHTDK